MVETQKEKSTTKTIAMLIALVVLVVVCCVAGSMWGEHAVCKRSGGTMFESGLCVNMGNLDYCIIDNSTIKYQPHAWVYDGDQGSGDVSGARS